jgi:alpha-glucosidase (family GH31 glycosyl hydrolase)
VKVKTFATGGSGDLHFMFGASPSAVTQQYHKIVGKPVLTPQWALGWSQCKWGYHTLDEVKQVVANYTEF